MDLNLLSMNITYLAAVALKLLSGKLGAKLSAKF